MVVVEEKGRGAPQPIRFILCRLQMPEQFLHQPTIQVTARHYCLWRHGTSTVKNVTNAVLHREPTAWRDRREGSGADSSERPTRRESNMLPHEDDKAPHQTHPHTKGIFGDADNVGLSSNGHGCFQRAPSTNPHTGHSSFNSLSWLPLNKQKKMRGPP